jgi:rRNA small subunit pseudouridine methyltransferase Nep1
MDDHDQYITKTLKKDAAKYRPDIIHRCLLAVYDSPLAKAMKVMVYIHTTEGQVIEISPEMRV